jgi:hypothetical protein
MGHTSCVLSDGTMLVTGGRKGPQYLNDVWKSTDGAFTWSRVTLAAQWAGELRLKGLVLYLHLFGTNSVLFFIYGRSFLFIILWCLKLATAMPPLLFPITQ